MRKIFVGLICICFIFQIFLSGQETGAEGWQELYEQSFEYFYNHEYEKSLDCLEKALELEPGQPAIYWRLSYVLWLTAQREYDQGRKKNVKELRKRFNEVTDEGIEICEELLMSNPNNSEFLFYLGTLYGNRGNFIAVTTSDIKYIFVAGKISRNTKKSREKLRKIEEIEPFYYEALGYLALLNYGPILAPKALLELIGYEWDEEKGLEQFGLAMAYNSRCSDDDKLMYRGILQVMIERDKFEDRSAEAIELTEDLLIRYPRNLILKLDLIILYWKWGKLITAKELGEKLCQEISLLIEDPEFPRYPYVYSLLYRLEYKILPKIEKELKKKK